MRFRATITSVSVFYKITQSIEKLQKRFTLKFAPENVHIICNHEANEGGTQVWSSIKVESIFTDYRIESNSNNEITMALSSEALLAALRSATSSSTISSYQAEEVVMKLAKKNDRAVLRFEIIAANSVGRNVKVSHDILVDVLKPYEVAKLVEPLCPEEDTHILLPPLHKLRTIVERLRPMSDILAFRASNNGTLQLAIRAETAEVQTEWKNLTNPKYVDEEPPTDEEVDTDKIFTVHVSIRSFLKFLNCHVISKTTIACICDNHCLILYVYFGGSTETGGVLTFYIPAIIDGD